MFETLFPEKHNCIMIMSIKAVLFKINFFADAVLRKQINLYQEIYFYTILSSCHFDLCSVSCVYLFVLKSYIGDI